MRELGCAPFRNRTERDVGAIEAAIGVALPPAYRTFLAECGGWCGDIRCPSEQPTPFGNHTIAGFHDATAVHDLLDSMITPRNMVTIASGHFGACTCISIAGIDRGSVYALDSEFRVFWSEEEFHQRFNAMADCVREYLDLRRLDQLPEKPAGYESTYFLASDFDEFLKRCHRCG
ncbi:MAG: SMI1/KNR4 family protein [Planctomycetia bacterium]|nr:SMI1/KNR4 family protein [Planctomycetia bacterium]